MAENISQKSLDFAVKIVKVYGFLIRHQEFIMSKQLLRCGTSIGANVAESDYAQSRADFISKSSIALKEAAETQYWLRVLYHSKYLDATCFNELHKDITEIIKILTAIVNTAKKNSQK